jgi:hypothetical protein
MEESDLDALASNASTIFRLETLPTYLVEQEDDAYTAWRSGDRTLLTPETNGWLAYIRDTTAAGVRWSRVHVLDYPLSDYSEFEVHGYQANAAAGERIYLADRTWSPDLAALREDFWLFDDTAVRMIYDQDGHFRRPELADNSHPYREMRAVALRHSLPLNEFLTSYEPRLIA